MRSHDVDHCTFWHLRTKCPFLHNGFVRITFIKYAISSARVTVSVINVCDTSPSKNFHHHLFSGIVLWPVQVGPSVDVWIKARDKPDEIRYV